MKITNEDNMELMARYEDNHFDLAIVDPPYGIGADKAQNAAAESRKKANGKSKAGRGWKEYKVSNWDNEIPTDEYFKELFRVSKKQIIWGGNYFPFIWNYSNSFLIWNKMQRDFSLADGELAWYSETQKAMRTFDFSRGGALADNNKNGGRFHPTQKPVKLYEWLLMNYAKEGDKILDTHLGSGSIALACHNLKYDLTACELDTEYYNAAMKRLKQHQQQLTIFDI
jgi:site-specific DNA-methyltransferase (adenine-specific)